jgi:hypothetical protein
MPFLIPLIVLGLGGVAFWKVKQTTTGLTPERKIIYETALETEKDPSKLRTLAAAYKKEGLVEEAALLEKRASLRDLPPEIKEARSDAYKAGMSSNNPEGVLKLASAFKQEGATGAAQSLVKYAGAIALSNRLVSQEHMGTKPGDENLTNLAAQVQASRALR